MGIRSFKAVLKFFQMQTPREKWLFIFIFLSVLNRARGTEHASSQVCWSTKCFGLLCQRPKGVPTDPIWLPATMICWIWCSCKSWKYLILVSAASLERGGKRLGKFRANQSCITSFRGTLLKGLTWLVHGWAGIWPKVQGNKEDRCNMKAEMLKLSSCI
jgi:hypothetical protein